MNKRKLSAKRPKSSSPLTDEMKDFLEQFDDFLANLSDIDDVATDKKNKDSMEKLETVSCKDCGKQQRIKEPKANWMKIHRGECSKVIKKSEANTKNVQRKTFKCKYCEESFNFSIALNAHYDICEKISQSQENLYKMWSSQYATPSLMKNHTKTEHKRFPRPVQLKQRNEGSVRRMMISV